MEEKKPDSRSSSSGVDPHASAASLGNHGLEAITPTAEVFSQQLDDINLNMRTALTHAIHLLEDNQFKGNLAGLKTLEKDLNSGNERLFVQQPLQEIVGLSNRDLMEVYELAANRFGKKLYVEAHDLFFLLTELAEDISSFWVALGLSEQMLEHYDLAAFCFDEAVDRDPADPTPLLHAAYCSKKEGNVEQALYYLDTFLEAIGHNEAFSGYRDQAQRLKNDYLRAA